MKASLEEAIQGCKPSTPAQVWVGFTFVNDLGTQPTMSRQIAQLESELGVQLFYRTTRNILLTQDGKLFRRRAEEILALVDKAEQELHVPSQELAGTITIVTGQFENFRIIADADGHFFRTAS